MQPGKLYSTIGCLMINELTSGERQLSGLSVFLGRKGVYSRHFSDPIEKNLHSRLQVSYQKVRAKCEKACVIGIGSGCWGALALAVQLPVERLVLIHGDASYSEEENNLFQKRQINRIAGFARRNMAFCVSRVLLIADESEKSMRQMKKLGGELYNSQIHLIRFCGDGDKDLCINCESVEKEMIYSFLKEGRLPKCLAEKAEMCIIY